MRKRLLRLYAVLAVAGIIYLVGLVVSFVVQPATMNAASRYLAVIVNMFVVSSIFVAAYAALNYQLPKAKTGQGVLLAALIVALVLVPVESISDAFGRTERDESQLAAETYVNGWMGDLPKNSRVTAVVNAHAPDLMESYELQAYMQYYALPLHVETIFCPNGTIMDLTKQELETTLTRSLSNILIVVTVDDYNLTTMAEILGIPRDTPQPWRVNVKVEVGSFRYELLDV